MKHNRVLGVWRTNYWNPYKHPEHVTKVVIRFPRHFKYTKAVKDSLDAVELLIKDYIEKGRGKND